jgi:hypothetical protein
MEEERDE